MCDWLLVDKKAREDKIKTSKDNAYETWSNKPNHKSTDISTLVNAQDLTANFSCEDK
jgi:hypothetical protein